MHLNSQQANELAVLRQRYRRCLSCVSPLDALSMLATQDQTAEQLKQQIAATEAEMHDVHAAMDGARQEHEAEAVQLLAHHFELLIAKIPWQARIAPIEKAIR